MGYFHIPDGCYFNYTELLDFVLWIYMFFSSSVNVDGGFSEGYSVVLNLLFIEASSRCQKYCSMGNHIKLPYFYLPLNLWRFFKV